MLSLVFQDDDMVIVGRTSSRSRKSPIPDTITALLTQPVLTRIYNEYDHRGNLTRQLQEGIPVHSYAYNAMDRLAKAWSHTPDGAVQTETSYYYNDWDSASGRACTQPCRTGQQEKGRSKICHRHSPCTKAGPWDSPQTAWQPPSGKTTSPT